MARTVKKTTRKNLSVQYGEDGLSKKYGTWSGNSEYDMTFTPYTGDPANVQSETFGETTGFYVDETTESPWQAATAGYGGMWAGIEEKLTFGEQITPQERSFLSSKAGGANDQELWNNAVRQYQHEQDHGGWGSIGDLISDPFSAAEMIAGNPLGVPGFDTKSFEAPLEQDSYSPLTQAAVKAGAITLGAAALGGAPAGDLASLETAEGSEAAVDAINNIGANVITKGLTDAEVAGSVFAGSDVISGSDPISAIENAEPGSIRKGVDAATEESIFSAPPPAPAPELTNFEDPTPGMGTVPDPEGTTIDATTDIEALSSDPASTSIDGTTPPPAPAPEPTNFDDPTPGMGTVPDPEGTTIDGTTEFNPDTGLPETPTGTVPEPTGEVLPEVPPETPPATPPSSILPGTGTILETIGVGTVIGGVLGGGEEPPPLPGAGVIINRPYSGDQYDAAAARDARRFARGRAKGLGANIFGGAGGFGRPDVTTKYLTGS